MSYKQFFAAFNRIKKNGNPYTRQEMVSGFTNGRTTSLKDLSAWELNELTIRINQVAGARHAMPLQPKYDPKSDKLRKAIISIFYQMNKEPLDAINWAEKQGVKGVKKQFNNYTNQELYKLIIIAEKVLSDFQLAIRNRLKRDLQE